MLKRILVIEAFSFQVCPNTGDLTPAVLLDGNWYHVIWGGGRGMQLEAMISDDELAAIAEQREKDKPTPSLRAGQRRNNTVEVMKMYEQRESVRDIAIKLGLPKSAVQDIISRNVK